MATTTITEALRRVDLFAGLSNRALDQVAKQVKSVPHPAGKVIAVEGKEGAAFHLIHAGSAEVLVNGQVVRTLGPGDYFGDLSLLDGKPRSATVRASSDLTTYAIVAWSFTPLLDQPEVSKALLLTMCARLRSAETR